MNYVSREAAGKLLQIDVGRCRNYELEICDANRGRGVVDGYNLDYLAGHVAKELSHRLGEEP